MHTQNHALDQKQEVFQNHALEHKQEVFHTLEYKVYIAHFLKPKKSIKALFVWWVYVAKPWNQIITITHTNFTTGIYMGTMCGLEHHLFFNLNILIFQPMQSQTIEQKHDVYPNLEYKVMWPNATKIYKHILIDVLFSAPHGAPVNARCFLCHLTTANEEAKAFTGWQNYDLCQTRDRRFLYTPTFGKKVPLILTLSSQNRNDRETSSCW